MPAQRTSPSSASSSPSCSPYQRQQRRQTTPLNFNIFFRLFRYADQYEAMQQRLFGRPDMMWKVQMVRHIWNTTDWLLDEVDRQRAEALRLWDQSETGGVHELLEPDWQSGDEHSLSSYDEDKNPLPRRSPSPSRHSSQRRQTPKPDEEPSVRIITQPSSPLGTRENPIIVIDDDEPTDSSSSFPYALFPEPHCE